jgi:iron complex transport system substrate-binding protein
MTAVLILACSLHLAQAFTGPLWLPHAADDYGRPGFTIGPPEYPRRATDSEHYELTISRAARTLAATEWTIEEFVYSIVPPETVVAVSDDAYDRRFSNVYALAEKHRPVMIGAIAPNAELVIRANPELVLAPAEQSNLINILRGADVPLYRMYNQFTKLDEIGQNILLTGYLTGHDQEARQVYANFQQAVARARMRKPAGGRSPRVLGYQFTYSYGRDTAFNDVLTAVGAINVGAEQGLRLYDAINSEQVLRWNPDWIVSGASRGQRAEVLQRILIDPAIRLTTAARDGHVLVLDMNVFVPKSPFTTLTLEALGDAFWGAKEEARH